MKLCNGLDIADGQGCRPKLQFYYAISWPRINSTSIFGNTLLLRGPITWLIRLVTVRADMFTGLHRFLADDDDTVRLIGKPLFTFSDGTSELLSETTAIAFTWPMHYIQ
jgi:hypothetical protein